MRKSEKAEINIMIDVMTGVVGPRTMRPILLRVFLAGYYFRAGFRAPEAAKKAETMANEMEAVI